ncbi:MAG: zinc-binding dehydrogenase [Phormidesmis sp.]
MAAQRPHRHLRRGRSLRTYLKNVAAGTYQMPIAGMFSLDQVQAAHTAMEKGTHIGKFILQP